MPSKANYLTMIKYGLKHPISVYYFPQENRRIQTNYRHPFLIKDDISYFEKHDDFLNALFSLQSIKMGNLSELKASYANNIKKSKLFMEMTSP